MGRAYIRAATMEVAINGFKKCGISPFDPLVFGLQDSIEEEETENVQSEKHASTSEAVELISPFQLNPPPSLPRKPSSAREGKAAVITNSPYKNPFPKLKIRK